MGANGAMAASSAAHKAADSLVTNSPIWEDALESDLVAELAVAEAADSQVVQELLHWAVAADSNMPMSPAVRMLADAAGAEETQRSPRPVPAAAAAAAAPAGTTSADDEVDDATSSSSSSSSTDSSLTAPEDPTTEDAAGVASRHPLMTPDNVALMM
jgi:hypothetical protein